MNMGHQWYKRLSVLLVGVLLTLALCVNPGWGAEEALNATTYDTAPGGSVTYNGSWTHASNWPRAYSGTVSYVNQYNAKVALTFNGRYITRVYTTASNRGNSRVYIDGAQKTNAATDNTSNSRWQVARTWDTGSSGQHTIEVYNNGGYIDADAFIVDIPTVTNGNFDNTHSQFKYIGNWTHGSGWSTAYNGTLSWSKNTEDAVTFTFTGDNISYFFTKTWNRGKVAVTIDGVDKGLIDLYSFSSAWKQVVTWSGLGSGVHTIHLAVSGQKHPDSTDYYIDVDMLKAGTAYNRTSAVNYADFWAHSRNDANYPNYGNPNDNPCNDCTNFIAQVLEAGGVPQIVDIQRDDVNVWYAYPTGGSWYDSLTWTATPEFKQHADAFSSRFQFKGTSSSAVEGLGGGDFFLMDDDVNPIQGPDHASIIVGWGYPQEGNQTDQWRLLRNAHCTDRKRVRWNYGLTPGDLLWAYKVIY